MNNKKKTILMVAVIIVALSIIAVVVLIANKKEVYRLIAIDSVEGTVELKREDEPVKIFSGMHLKSGDRVATGEASNALLLADGDKHILAEENTGFSISATGNEKKGGIIIHLEYGSALITIDNKLNKDSSFELETPNAILGVRGTIFRATYDRDLLCTTVEIIEGTVEITSEKQVIMGNAGETYYVDSQGVIQVGTPDQEQGENQGTNGSLEIGTDIEPLQGDGNGPYDSIPQAEFESLYLVERIELTPENSHEYFQVIEKDGTYYFVLKPGFTAYGDGYRVVLDNGSEAAVSAGGSRYLFVMSGEGDPNAWIKSWTASGTIIKHSIPDELWFKAGDKYIIMIKMDNGNVFTIER
ncbi:MAG: FecR domain-containing protein [Lachnospiraceae bacterium]|nr:FecR domain-containing protein [Lachnospiraceae bacterium]